jgi:predicted nucleic acid-binding protein
MIIVSDTTPLSELSKIGKLDLLHDIFGRVIITKKQGEKLLLLGVYPLLD